MMKRTTYIVAAAGCVACGLLLLYALRRRDWPSLPTRGPVFSLFNEAGLLVPTLAILVAWGVGVQILNLALVVRSTTPQRIVSLFLMAVLALPGAFVGVCGVVGWSTFAQQDSPYDDFAGMTIVPLAAQTLFGFLVALGAIIYLWLYFEQIDLFAAFDDVEELTP